MLGYSINMQDININYFGQWYPTSNSCRVAVIDNIYV